MSDVREPARRDEQPTELERLIGFKRVSLAPGQTQHVMLTADPRLLANFDTSAHGWRITAGGYSLALSRSADDTIATAASAGSGGVI